MKMISSLKRGGLTVRDQDGVEAAQLGVDLQAERLDNIWAVVLVTFLDLIHWVEMPSTLSPILLSQESCPRRADDND